MHYYQFHIKDYHAATAHLSNEEDLCYRRMLDLYYEQEGGFSDPSIVARRVRFPVETVTQILTEFFECVSDSWNHKRADREIRGYQAMKSASKRGAEARWNKDLMPTPCPPHTPPHADPNANHEPLTINHEPDSLLPTEVGKTGKPVVPPCPTQEIIDLYHQKLPQCPRLVVRTAARDKSISARWRQFFAEGDFSDKQGGIGCFDWYFGEVAKSKFLTGKVNGRNGGSPFVADLEWLMRPANFAKVAEGRYGNR